MILTAVAVRWVIAAVFVWFGMTKFSATQSRTVFWPIDRFGVRAAKFCRFVVGAFEVCLGVALAFNSFYWLSWMTFVILGVCLSAYGAFAIRATGDCGCGPEKTAKMQRTSTRTLLLRNLVLFGATALIVETTPSITELVESNESHSVGFIAMTLLPLILFMGYSVWIRIANARGWVHLLPSSGILVNS